MSDERSNDSPPPRRMVEDGRIKRDLELTNYIRALARQLAERRGIVRRLAAELVERRRRDREYYFGRGAEMWAAWVEKHPEHATNREPEPAVITIEEAIPLVIAAAERQVWKDAYEQGMKDLADRQRRHLDQLWMFLRDAEAVPPSPTLSREERVLVRDAYTMGSAILGWAHLVESGRGAEHWKTHERRPLKPIKTALRRILDHIESQPDYVRMGQIDRAEKVLAVRHHLHRSFDASRKLYREWRLAVGKEWATQQGTVHRKITTAFETDLEAVVWGPKDTPRLRAILDRVLTDRRLSKHLAPADAADEAASIVMGVTKNMAREGAKELLAKAPAPPPRRDSGPSVGPPTAMSKLTFELHSLRLERRLIRKAARVRRRK